MAFLVLGAGWLAVAGGADAESGKSFEDIMQSISQQGSIPNGDGHRWRFRQADGGGWEVEGARGRTAEVTGAGPDAVEIDGFPRNWGANGRYRFSAGGGTCQLEAERSRHRLEWSC